MKGTGDPLLTPADISEQTESQGYLRSAIAWDKMVYLSLFLASAAVVKKL